MDFQPRDLIRLISGGPLMVVNMVADGETVWCSWRELGDRQIRRQSFSPDVLKRIEKPTSQSRRTAA